MNMCLAYIVGIGKDAALLVIKVTVHKNGIMSGAFVGVNPIFTWSRETMWQVRG